jgi:hypothetical protein
MTTEFAYVRFTYDNYGYMIGDVVKVEVLQRDSRGIQVHMFSQESRDMGELITAWSDLGGFREMTEMGVLAHFASNRAVL